MIDPPVSEPDDDRRAIGDRQLIFSEIAESVVTALLETPLGDVTRSSSEDGCALGVG
jgi:hypothetical protein